MKNRGVGVVSDTKNQLNALEISQNCNQIFISDLLCSTHNPNPNPPFFFAAAAATV